MIVAAHECYGFWVSAIFGHASNTRQWTSHSSVANSVPVLPSLRSLEGAQGRGPIWEGFRQEDGFETNRVLFFDSDYPAQGFTGHGNISMLSICTIGGRVAPFSSLRVVCTCARVDHRGTMTIGICPFQFEFMRTLILATRTLPAKVFLHHCMDMYEYTLEPQQRIAKDSKGQVYAHSYSSYDEPGPGTLSGVAVCMRR